MNALYEHKIINNEEAGMSLAKKPEPGTDIELKKAYAVEKYLERRYFALPEEGLCSREES